MRRLLIKRLRAFGVLGGGAVYNLAVDHVVIAVYLWWWEVSWVVRVPRRWWGRFVFFAPNATDVFKGHYGTGWHGWFVRLMQA